MQLTDRLYDKVRRIPPLVVDLSLVAVLSVVTVVAVLVDSQQEDEPLTTGGVVLLAAQLVPLVWRRRAPVIVAGVSLAAAMAYGMAKLPDPPVMFGPLLAIYTVGAYRPRSVSVPFAALVMVAAGFSIVLGDDSDAADITVGYFTGTTAWLLGVIIRDQRERAAWLDERRADAARQAAVEERVRIARDLHDVVAHHVSVIAIQAEAAQEVLAAQPDRAGEAMVRVADTARTALVELRRLLGVLRSDTSLAPQPDLGQVDELVESVRRTGLDVAVHTSGETRPVDSVVGMTAYRVIQEALTNVLKHAGPCRAEVRLDYADDALLVMVSDDGRAAPRRSRSTARNGRGHGLVGMRERVAVLGGSLAAGPVDGGGFQVRARLPLPEGR